MSCPKGLDITFCPYTLDIKKCDEFEYKIDCHNLIKKCVNLFDIETKNIDNKNVCLKEFYPHSKPIKCKHKKDNNIINILVLSGKGKLLMTKGNEKYSIDVSPGIAFKFINNNLSFWNHTFLTDNSILKILVYSSKKLKNKNPNGYVTIVLTLNANVNKKKAIVIENECNLPMLNIVAKNKFKLMCSQKLQFYVKPGNELRSGDKIEHKSYVYVSVGEPYMGPIKIKKPKDKKDFSHVPIIQYKEIEKWVTNWKSIKVSKMEHTILNGIDGEKYKGKYIFGLEALNKLYLESYLYCTDFNSLIKDIGNIVDNYELFWGIDTSNYPDRHTTIYIVDEDRNFIGFRVDGNKLPKQKVNKNIAILWSLI